MHGLKNSYINSFTFISHFSQQAYGCDVYAFMVVMMKKSVQLQPKTVFCFAFLCDCATLVEDVEFLLPITFLLGFIEFRLVVSEEKSKMYQPIRGEGGHLVFTIRPNHKNLVEDDEILLPVRFRCIALSGFRAAILFFRSAPKNTNLAEDVKSLLPVKFPWILFSGFRREVENVKR